MDDDGFDVETGEWVGDSNRVDESDYRAFIERVRDKPKKDFLKELRRCLEGFLRPRCRPWESHEQDLVAFNHDFREGAGKLPYVVDFGEEQDDIAEAFKSLSHIDWVLKQDEGSGELHFSESEYLVGRAVSQIDNQEFRKKAAELDEKLRLADQEIPAEFRTRIITKSEAGAKHGDKPSNPRQYIDRLIKKNLGVVASANQWAVASSGYLISATSQRPFGS